MLFSKLGNGWRIGCGGQQIKMTKSLEIITNRLVHVGAASLLVFDSRDLLSVL